MHINAYSGRLSKRSVFFTKYDFSGASSRYRTLQYLRGEGSIEKNVTIFPLFSSRYIEVRYKSFLLKWMLVTSFFFIRRLTKVMLVRPSDTVYIEYELLPFFPPLLELYLKALGCRLIFDYDDAIFARYQDHRFRVVRFVLGNKIAKLMRMADAVVVGNEYLAEYAHQCGCKRVEIIPTVVDLNRYCYVKDRSDDKSNLVIGWIGSPSTVKYVADILPVLDKLIVEVDFQLHLIGAGDFYISREYIQTRQWNYDTEIEMLLSFDIGIMPIPCNSWTKGKCGFKLVQYLACGIPVVASAVGINKKLCVDGLTGFQALSDDDWHHALTKLLMDKDLRAKMGREGRRLIVSQFSLQQRQSQFFKVVTEC